MPIGELARLRACECDKFVHVLGRHVAMDHKHARREDHERDRGQVLDRVVRQLFVQARIDGNGGTGHHQRVTVGRGLCGTLDRNIAAGAGRILDQDGFAPGLGKLVCKQPRCDVRGTAGRKTDENSNGFVRIGGLGKPGFQSFSRTTFSQTECFTSPAQSGYWPFSVTSTIRKRAFPAIIRSYASRALDRGMTSIIGSTFSSKENSTVSCSSCTLPVVDPEMECMPKTRELVFTSSGSGASPITNNFPLTASPFTSPDIALPLGAVARMASAPPSARSLAPASSAPLSMYCCAPSSFASFSDSGPRPTATVRNPILLAY